MDDDNDHFMGCFVWVCWVLLAIALISFTRGLFHSAR